MSETNNTKPHPGISIPGIVVSAFSLITCIFFLFILFKTKVFLTYSFYFVIIFNILIIIDNIFRMIPFDNKDSNDYNIMEAIQAFCLIFLNKFEFSILTMQNFIYYLGIKKTDLFSSKKTIIFYITLFLSFFISLIIAIIIFINSPLKAYKIYCFIENTTFTSFVGFLFHMIFYILSVIFLIIIIKYLCSKRKEAASGLIEDLDYKHHLCKIYVLYIIYIGIFVVSFSLNNEKDRDEYYPDLIYLILVFFLD